MVVGLVHAWFGWFGVHGFSSSFSSVGSMFLVRVVRSSVVRGSSFSSVGSVVVGLVQVLVWFGF